MSPKLCEALDLFGGGGGFARGFIEAGFKVVLTIDNNKNAARTYKFNFPETIVLAEDIKEVSPAEVLRILGRKPSIIIGSPPCEPFTAANKKRMDKPIDRLYVDPLGRLTLSFLRFVKELQPSVFVMENVPAIMEGELKEAIEEEFRKAGYSEVFFNVLNAEDYCTPSKRRRVFISNIQLKPKKCEKRITVAEALFGLPEPNPYSPPNHELSHMSRSKEKKAKKVKAGRALVYYEGYGGKILPNLIKLLPDDVSPTVLGSSRFIHPYEDRLLTVREQARLMGYPDSHVFLGGKDEQYNMVGESVPPTLSKAIGEYIRLLITRGEVSCE